MAFVKRGFREKNGGKSVNLFILSLQFQLKQKASQPEQIFLGLLRLERVLHRLAKAKNRGNKRICCD